MFPDVRYGCNNGSTPIIPTDNNPVLERQGIIDNDDVSIPVSKNIHSLQTNFLCKSQNDLKIVQKKLFEEDSNETEVDDKLLPSKPLEVSANKKTEQVKYWYKKLSEKGCFKPDEGIQNHDIKVNERNTKVEFHGIVEDPEKKTVKTLIQKFEKMSVIKEKPQKVETHNSDQIKSVAGLPDPVK